MKQEIKPMLARTYAGQDVAGWMMQEKFDGIRAVWDGETLWTREGNRINAPAAWLARLPAGIALDGELWAGRGRFAVVESVRRRKGATVEDWAALSFVAFDAPEHGGTAAERIEFVESLGVECADTWNCLGESHARETMRMFVADGGEGIVLRDPSAPYVHGRSRFMLKMKPGEGF